MPREFSSIWYNWIKNVYYQRKDIFGCDCNSYDTEVHHINGKGSENDNRPINVIVIPKLLHYLYTQQEYDKCILYIKERLGNDLWKNKNINNMFTDYAINHFNDFINNNNNINNLPQGEYISVIESTKIINEDCFVFSGSITDNNFKGIRIEGLVKRNDSFYNILSRKKARWIPDDFIGYKTKIEIYHTNNKMYANYKNLGE